MATTQEAVKLASKLYAARDSAKFILGEKYRGRMAEYGNIIKAVIDKKGLCAITAATLLAEQSANPFQQLSILAAAVELIEPSEEATA